MTHTYLSTFISGFGEIVANHLPTVVSNARLIKVFDGLVLFESSQLDAVSKLRFINNSFIVLSSCKTKDTDKSEVVVERLIAEAKNTQFPAFFKKFKTFKVFVSKENQTISISKNVRSKSVDYVLHRTKLKLEPLVSDLEFWFIIRREGNAYFAVRVPSEKKKQREKGELAPELSHFLCMISEPNATDIILDPFAGSGSILLERTKSFPFKHAIVSDIETSKNLHRQFASRKDVEIKDYDALNLENIQNNSITKIITDPPWGMYKENEASRSNVRNISSHKEQNPSEAEYFSRSSKNLRSQVSAKGDKTDYVKFYTKMLNEFERVLARDGIAVILTARKGEFEKALENVPSFNLKEKYHILVSGKKAGVYKTHLR